MQLNYLEDVIHKYCHKMAEHAASIPGKFDKEDIHELRVNYKKLRAFVRLLQEDPDAGKHLSVPEDLKEVYKGGANVRDKQLFIDFLNKSIKEPAILIPQYVSRINKDLFKAKEKLVVEIEEASFKDAESKLKKSLPSFLHDEAIHRFVHRKVAAVQLILLSLENDEDLHGIRKHLKDLLYVIKIFETEWGISFPIHAWKSEKALTDITTALGEYNDLSIAVGFLDESTMSEFPEQEKSVLLSIKEKSCAQKSRMQEELLNKVRGLKLVSQFD
jgi:CHAD domain-containing protein